MIDKALLNECLSESEQLLDSLLTDLEQLAALGTGEAADRPPVALAEVGNRIFRNVHSQK
jgi:hypothetical protein